MEENNTMIVLKNARKLIEDEVSRDKIEGKKTSKKYYENKLGKSEGLITKYISLGNNKQNIPEVGIDFVINLSKLSGIPETILLHKDITMCSEEDVDVMVMASNIVNNFDKLKLVYHYNHEIFDGISMCFPLFGIKNNVLYNDEEGHSWYQDDMILHSSFKAEYEFKDVYPYEAFSITKDNINHIIFIAANIIGKESVIEVYQATPNAVPSEGHPADYDFDKILPITTSHRLGIDAKEALENVFKFLRSECNKKQEGSEYGGGARNALKNFNLGF